MLKFISIMVLVLGAGLTAKAGWPFPQPPNQGPGYNDIYGPARTVRWDYVGAFQTEKFFEIDVNIEARDQFVNEVMVAAQDNDVEVVDAIGYLSNGQSFRINNMIGTIPRGRQYQVQLDWRNSLRLSRIVYRISTSNMIGPRGTFYVQLGLAY